MNEPEKNENNVCEKQTLVLNSCWFVSCSRKHTSQAFYISWCSNIQAFILRYVKVCQALTFTIYTMDILHFLDSSFVLQSMLWHVAHKTFTGLNLVVCFTSLQHATRFSTKKRGRSDYRVTTFCTEYRNRVGTPVTQCMWVNCEQSHPWHFVIYWRCCLYSA